MAAQLDIRRYRAGDGAALRGIFLAAVLQIGRRFYSGPQVEAWAARAATAERYDEKAADGRVLLVALDVEGQPAAYGDVEPDGHIDHLFCRPDLAGKGLASSLYNALEEVARGRGIDRLYVEASEAAQPLFLRKGFAVVRRSDFEIGGVRIHNYRMEKRL
jgi:putative acetyltransferase